MGRATDKMLSFARDIADELGLDMPTKKDESGNVMPDESFDAIHDFIEENKDEFYVWRRG